MAAVLIEVVVEVEASEEVEVADLEEEEVVDLVEEVDEVDLTGSRTMAHRNMLSVRPIYFLSVSKTCVHTIYSKCILS